MSQNFGTRILCMFIITKLLIGKTITTTTESGEDDDNDDDGDESLKVTLQMMIDKYNEEPVHKDSFGDPYSEDPKITSIENDANQLLQEKSEIENISLITKVESFDNLDAQCVIISISITFEDRQSIENVLTNIEAISISDPVLIQVLTEIFSNITLEGQILTIAVGEGPFFRIFVQGVITNCRSTPKPNSPEFTSFGRKIVTAISSFYCNSSEIVCVSAWLVVLSFNEGIEGVITYFSISYVEEEVEDILVPLSDASSLEDEVLVDFIKNNIVQALQEVNITMNLDSLIISNQTIPQQGGGGSTITQTTGIPEYDEEENLPEFETEMLPEYETDYVTTQDGQTQTEESIIQATSIGLGLLGSIATLETPENSIGLTTSTIYTTDFCTVFDPSIEQTISPYVLCDEKGKVLV